MTDELDLDGDSVAIRVPTCSDLPALARFAAAVPPHDLLFLARDIREPRVLQAWVEGVEEGGIVSLIALSKGEIIATVAALSDALSWSRHVWDIRLLVAAGHRNKGLGRRLLDGAIERVCALGAGKLTARMTPDQKGAITLFEECGFRAEALLRDQVRDSDGRLHDLALLYLDPVHETARRSAFGEVAP
ncbi:N-acetyltransferase family protein [Tsuneonella sp. HG249]